MSGSATSGESPADAGSIDYADVTAADVEGETVELSTVDGTVWRIPLDDDPTVVDAVGRHLEWVGHVRGRVVATENDVDLATGEITEARDAMDWEATAETYRRARDRLDATIELVQRTEPIPDDALAPDLTVLERRLECAYATTAIERANSRLTLAQQLVANEDHERARDALAAARADHETAADRALSVRRGDDFRFGEHRDLQDRLERLEWEIQAVAAEPLRLAHEAKILAREADGPDESVDQWETAYRRYGDLLALSANNDERHFAGDRDAVEDELANAAGQLVAIHHVLARNEWNEGVQYHREGDTVSAALRLDAAVEHQARATDVATEYRPATAAEFEERLEEMRDGLARVRRTGSADRSPATGGNDGDADVSADGPHAGVDDQSSGTGITASELADLDTHTEITFDDGTVVREGPTREQQPAGESQLEDTTHGDAALRRDGEDDD